MTKTRIQKAFSRSARRYEANASLQQETARQLSLWLISRLHGSSPRRILDIGIGTGYLTQLLRSYYPDAEIIGCDLACGMLNIVRRKGLKKLNLLEADAERLPFKNAGFDLIVSNLTYQWVEDIASAMAEALRILVPGGHLFFTSLGADSLQELRHSYSQAYLENKGCLPAFLQEFHNYAYLKDIIGQSGFRNICIERQLQKLTYSSPHQLLNSLRNIGAVNSSRLRPKGLASRRILQNMEQFYQQTYSGANGILATYEIIRVEAGKG
ncbi:MAG: malonyl-ACP O-methyltransferase BioC [Candidatus Schekmanbacteria bacterium]|nr:malonyl-ACP O-methyltransferase BioC [Candidatus Schekmanbacteria bacterium]